MDAGLPKNVASERSIQNGKIYWTNLQTGTP